MKKKVKDLRRSGIVFAAVAGIVLMLTGCTASPGGLFGNDHKETDKTGSSSVKRREEKTDKKSTGDKDTAVLGIIYTRDTEGNSLISWRDDDLSRRPISTASAMHAQGTAWSICFRGAIMSKRTQKNS